MKPPELKHWTVQTLYHNLKRRAFAVPKLQRNFVWDAGRAAKLLDSMYRQMPIGSVFLWEMDRKSAHLIRQSAQVLPAYDDRNSKIWFVIDGQQRLSVLYQAFEGEQRENDKGQKIDFSRLCFAVNVKNDPDDPAPRIVYRKPRERELIPITDLLRPDWKRRMPSRSKVFLRKARVCRERLLKYVVPMVIVRSATLEEIGEVFIRVNSQGMRITSADKAIAWMGKLDVSDMARELRRSLREQRFGVADIQPILMGFNLVTEKLDLDGDPPKLDMMARRWARAVERDERTLQRFKLQWDRFKKAFLTATQYLHDRFPVHDASYLPSANMLSTLAVFFYHHAGQPSTQQAREIRKWFWATGVGARYTGAGYHRNIVADARMFRRLAQKGRARFVFEERIDPMEVQAERYNAGSARTRAFFCLLARQKPCYLDDGEPIHLDGQVINPASARHRHHIFPRAQLNRYFPARVYNSLCNICFLVSSDNQGIGSRLPRNYLLEYRETKRRRFRALTESHLIPAGSGSGVWEQNVRRAFKQFRTERLKVICKAFEKEAGMKLFRWER